MHAIFDSLICASLPQKVRRSVEKQAKHHECGAEGAPLSLDILVAGIPSDLTVFFKRRLGFRSEENKAGVSSLRHSALLAGYSYAQVQNMRITFHPSPKPQKTSLRFKAKKIAASRRDSRARAASAFVASHLASFQLVGSCWLLYIARR